MQHPFVTGVEIAFLVFYFMPVSLAVLRHSMDISAVFLVNLVFGWTVIGWLIALAWALTSDSSSRRAY